MPSKILRAALKTAKAREDNNFRQEATLTCTCNRDVSLAELGRSFPARSKERLELFLPHINEMFKKYEVNSCLRKAHFLAQVGHETAQLSLLAEDLGKGKQEKDVYDGYKGRGLIQITYEAGYAAYGKYVGRDFSGDKKVDLEEIKWATDSAGWYWSVRTKPSLNNYADKNDLIYISQSINGAFNGYLDRLMLLGKAAEALLVPQCPNQPKGPEMNSFRLEHSAANDISAAAFAWGLWHDPQSSKAGTKKLKSEAAIGYGRFLELKVSQKRPRFGFKTADAMIKHAEARLDVLGSNND